MFYRLMVLTLLLGNSVGCVSSGQGADSSAQPADKAKPALNAKCEDAKQQFNQAVKAGEKDLRELKRNIELYCVWRQ